MLVAEMKNGERVSLGEKWEKRELSILRKNEKFFCPACKEEVMMKLGNKKVWHFSHLPNQSCMAEFERESDYHRAGKLQIYHWLKQQGILAELEKYDPYMRQKPDIFFEWRGDRYALEFQCSVISEEIFLKRTNTYLQHGYTPIWIAGGHLMKRGGANLASLNDFMYLFIRKPLTQWNISYYCPLSQQFIFLSPIIPITSRKAITLFNGFPLTNLSVEQLIFPPQRKFPFIHAWNNEMKKKKMRHISSRGSYQDPFLKELYQNQLNLLLLPPELGLPVFSGPYIKTSPLIWQTYLYLDLLRWLKKGDSFSLVKAESAFFGRVRQHKIRLRRLPGGDKDGHRQAVYDYLQLLIRIGMLKEVNGSIYRLEHEMHVPKSHQDQEKEQKEFNRRYGKLVNDAYMRFGP